MKRIAFLLSLSISFVPYSVLALSARTVSIEEAQGISGSIITLEVAPGYGLNINLIPTGEIVKKAWIDDPSRITISFDGNLCQGATQEEQCNNEGATVIHLRQIQPIAFPSLPRSAGGGTLLTLITEGSQGRKIYQFKVMPVSGAPKYTLLNVSSENPANTLLLRGRSVPLMVNDLPRRRSQNTARAYQQRNPTRNSQLEQPSNTVRAERTGQPPFVTKPNKPILAVPVSTSILFPIQDISPTPISPFSLPETPLPVDNKLTPTAIITDSETASTSNNKPKQTVATSSTAKTPVPLNSTFIKPKTTTPNPKVSPSPNSATSTAVGSKPKTPQLPDKVAATEPQASTSVGQANALVRGLVVARQKGQINSKTKVWKQVQSVVLLLRRGATAQEAAKKVGVSLQLVERLIAWGNNSPISTITSSK